MRKSSGYPVAYWKSLRRFLVRFLLFLAAFFALFCVCAYNVIYADAPIVVAACPGGFFLYFLLVLWIVVRTKPKLVLYFESKVPGVAGCGARRWRATAFSSTNYVIRSAWLLCRRSALPTNSAAKQWSGTHRKRGLKTAAALMGLLRDNSVTLPENAAIAADLQKLSERLQAAETERVNFCFILHEGSINAMEIEQRRGHFWIDLFHKSTQKERGRFVSAPVRAFRVLIADKRPHGRTTNGD